MAKKDLLVRMRNLEIIGITDEKVVPIINGVDLDLHRGEVLGLIGESGAGKSTLGLAAMGYTRDGCHITGGEVNFDGIDLLTASPQQKRDLLGSRIAYVAQSAAASFNPAHRIIKQHSEAPAMHQVMPRRILKRMRSISITACVCPTLKRSASAIRIRFPAASCSGP